MVVAWEAFYRLAVQRRSKTKVPLAGESLSIGTIDTAVGALLALILAFSFSMAAERFDWREGVIVKEANAIGTAHFRCSFMVPEEQAGCREDLARYARVRVQFFEAGHNSARLKAVLDETAEVQRSLWARVERSVPHRDTASTSLLIDTLNQLFSLDTERVAAQRRVVPEEITVVTIALCIAWSGFMGYSFGLSANRQLGAWLAFAGLVSLVVMSTLDLDRPARGFIRPTRGHSVMMELAEQLRRVNNL